MEMEEEKENDSPQVKSTAATVGVFLGRGFLQFLSLLTLPPLYFVPQCAA